MNDNLPIELEVFIHGSKWIFAKTYAEAWPHEYIVEEKVDRALFNKLAEYIDSNGSLDYFYQKQMIYLEYDGHVYWHMENIINRCLSGETYSKRKAENRLPS
jgi:hypothetical protein